MRIIIITSNADPNNTRGETCHAKPLEETGGAACPGASRPGGRGPAGGRLLVLISRSDQPGADGTIIAVGAENEYADVIAQVGGKYVQASAIMSNPNTDPHTFEASASTGRLVNAARLVVQNGLGYDTFMDTIEKAVPDSGRRTIVVQKLLGLPDSTPNPHLWYDPATMPKVADAIADNLAAIQPSHAAYFKANAKTFTNSLQRLDQRDRELQAARTPARPWPPPNPSPTTCCRPSAPTTRRPGPSRPT